MAWKQIQQMSLADLLLNEHECLKELDNVAALIDWRRIESLFHNIHTEVAWGTTGMATLDDVQSPVVTVAV